MIDTCVPFFVDNHQNMPIRILKKTEEKRVTYKIMIRKMTDENGYGS
jgi:hypothetical protein